ncbi:hypothetical protein, partial [Prevotella jejuni]|uniref:hypothetical protein n=1 Tax=Prevotella jejuni TaxID=1177574 RepID=UPI00352DFB25
KNIITYKQETGNKHEYISLSQSLPLLNRVSCGQYIHLRTFQIGIRLIKNRDKTDYQYKTEVNM